MASSVPKFASFRPKPKPDSQVQPSKEAQVPDKGRRPEKENAQKKERSTTRPKQASSIKDFFSDRRGDPDVLRYGSLNRYDIPNYRRYGNGCILGLPRREKIDRENSTDKKIYTIPTTRQRRERILTKKHAIRSSDRDLRFIKVDQFQADLDQDFIAVSGTGKRKRRDSSSGSDEEPSELAYRGVERQKNLDHPLDPDTKYESDTYTTESGSKATRTNSELARHTKEHPEELQAWLHFIDHQQEMLKLDRNSAELGASEKAHLADVRIAIYEEALKKMGADKSSREILHRGLMREALKSWHGAKVADKWKGVLSEFPHSIDLSLKYLDFEQSSFARCKFEGCRSAFLKCLQNLHSSPDGIAVETALHILLRLTSMIHEAGYQELSLAIWQAILEFHVLRPASSKDIDGQDDFRAFEEFWESEAPRIGEPGAKGWKSPSVDEDSPPENLTLPTRQPSDTSLEFFQKREVESIDKLRYPGRSSDETGDDDAFHIIFFSDIEIYLKILPSNVSTTLIVEAFLCFCGLPPLAHVTSHQRLWAADPFLQRNSCTRSRPSEELNSLMKTFQRYSDCPIRGFEMSCGLLLDQDFSLGQIKLSPNFVRRLLNLAALNNSSEDSIREYLLAFELFHFRDQVAKTAKKLLKAHPSSLRLYNAYGLVEFRRGNFAKADQVFAMALSMQNATDPLSTTASLELFNSWVWSALQRNERTEALWRLVSPDGRILGRNALEEQPDDGSLLRFRTLLRETSERALLSHDLSVAVLSSSLLAILTYLRDELDIATALATHQNLTSWFASHKLSKSHHAELHAQSVAQLLSYHGTHAPIVKPALIRTTLSPLISHFPENTILLALFAANEARSAVDDRVRSIMHQNVLHSSDATSVVGWVFAIHHESLRGEIAGSTAHSIRALYKRATDSTGAHCPAIWKSYFRFELLQLAKESNFRIYDKPSKGEKKSNRTLNLDEARQRAKDVFHAGLKNLPWCKDFMMMAFTVAPDHLFGEEELWRVYRVLQEKELRLYTELDEDDA